MAGIDRSSPLSKLMCFAQTGKMSPVWLHARMKRLTLACFSTYVEDAVHQGHSKLSIRTVDTDVVVLAITAAQRLNII